SDKESMHVNVLDYEPEIALFVPNTDPLMFYRRIAETGRSSLKKKGRLYFEIHEEFGDSIKELLHDLGYAEIRIHKDMQGKDRIACATNSTSK
ncbi:MAG: peptide chain release factor N(5)-glutamine methyltransferase, partial [Bacteroidota bacterium]